MNSYRIHWINLDADVSGRDMLSARDVDDAVKKFYATSDPDVKGAKIVAMVEREPGMPYLAPGRVVECYPISMGGGPLLERSDRLVECRWCEREHVESMVSECEGYAIMEEGANVGWPE